MATTNNPEASSTIAPIFRTGYAVFKYAAGDHREFVNFVFFLILIIGAAEVAAIALVLG